MRNSRVSNLVFFVKVVCILFSILACWSLSILLRMALYFSMHISFRGWSRWRTVSFAVIWAIICSNFPRFCLIKSSPHFSPSIANLPLSSIGDVISSVFPLGVANLWLDVFLKLSLTTSWYCPRSLILSAAFFLSGLVFVLWCLDLFRRPQMDYWGELSREKFWWLGDMLKWILYLRSFSLLRIFSKGVCINLSIYPGNSLTIHLFIIPIGQPNQ